MPRIPSIRRPWQRDLQAEPDRRNSLHDRFYDTSAWRNLRKYMLAEHPFCATCLANGQHVAADVVDHVLPRRAGGADLDPNNLQTLCHKCHLRKTANDKQRYPAHG